MNEEDMNQCANYLANAKRVIVFTGAGMSAESGIGTFRGGSGLWTGMLGKVVLGVFGTPFGWNWLPGFAWTQYVDKFYNPIRDAAPNPGHISLAELEKMYDSFDIITQNVDGLHQEAGNSPDLVHEVHGTVRRHCCVKKKHIYSDFESKTIPDKSPICKVEGCGSTLRPDCTLFTESLPMEAFSRSHDAVSQLRKGDVMIIVGTSANVYPAASFPKLAAKRGAHLIDVNLEPTPFQACSNYNFLGGGAATVLPELVERVKTLKSDKK